MTILSSDRYNLVKIPLSLTAVKTLVSKKPANRLKWLKKVSTACLLVFGTTVAIFPRVLSHVPFPKDGAIAYIPYPDTQLAQSHQEIFFIAGVIRDASNERLAKNLAKQTGHPITLVYNGSSCKDNHSPCSKFWDYAKAGLNRINNLWTGRGNEPIISSFKKALASSLLTDKQILIIAHSEGSLITAEAIKDLHSLNQFNLKKISFVALGSPMPPQEVAKLKLIVGEVKFFSDPNDPIVCLQKDLFQFPNLADFEHWFIVNPDLKKCLAAGNIRYHGEDYYWQHYLFKAKEEVKKDLERAPIKSIPPK